MTNYVYTVTTNYVICTTVTNTVTKCFSIDRYGRRKLITCQ